MPYQSLKIKDAIDKIESFEYLIPDIQREFVWSAEQIELLFDSIMCEYPIGTMLFWEVSGDTKFDYRFYKFLKEYKDHFSTSGESHFFKRPADQNTNITAILDGQQRLTALYIGVKGSYSVKKPRLAIKNKDDNFFKKKLYIQIDGESGFNKDDGREYNFKFLTNEEFRSNYNIWFPVDEIFQIKELADINDIKYLEANRNGRRIVSTLYNKLHSLDILNYYVERSQDIDKALNIFIRVNNQGEPLSYPDLIMSIVVSNWKFKDAKKEFRSIIEIILDLGFNIKKDFILKVFLALHSPNIKFLVKNFTANMARTMEEEWDTLKESLEFTFKSLSELGFTDSLLTSKNAIIPLVFVFYNVGNKTHYFDSNKLWIKNWLSLMLYMQVFSGSSDTTLTLIRNTLHKLANKYKTQFPYEDLNNELKNSGYLASPDEGFIENTFMSGKNSNYLYISNLLYPNEVIQIKDIKKLYPDLNTKQLRSLNLDSSSEKMISDYLNSYLNCILVKNEKPFIEPQDPAYKMKDLSFSTNFNIEFIETMRSRKEFLLKKIKAAIDL